MKKGGPENPNFVQNPARRRFLQVLGIGGSAAFVYSLGDMIHEGVQLATVANKALEKYPPQPEGQIKEAQQETTVFEQNMRQQAKEGKFGEELKQAYELLDKKAMVEENKFAEENRLKREIDGNGRDIRNVGLGLGGGIAAAIAFGKLKFRFS